MITFMILTTILAVLAITAVVLAISGGTVMALMLSDVIVFILIVWFIVWLGNKLHKKGSLSGSFFFAKIANYIMRRYERRNVNVFWNTVNRNWSNAYCLKFEKGLSPQWALSFTFN